MKKLEQSCLHNRQLRLYIHIPFCMSKCHYCDFYSHVGTDEEQNEYVKEIIRDIVKESSRYKDREVTSIFVGGGTPSILDTKSMKQIMGALYENFFIQERAEISIEMNPKTKTKDRLIAYRSMGFNRLSIGMQTTNEEELKSLGRVHTYQEFLDTFQDAREAGFDNINVDIMGAIPGQTISSYRETLQKVCELAPEHISSYSLILEEDTKFFDWYVKEMERVDYPKNKLPSEDEEREMYMETETILYRYGYHRYEISNFSKQGMECKHNIGYWTGDDYLGFGKTASSMVDHIRWTNGLEEKHEVTICEQMEEFMFLGLRMMNGISRTMFREQFHKSVEEIYGDQIKYLMNEGLLQAIDKDRISLTRRGIDVSNYVFGKFLQNVV